MRQAKYHVEVRKVERSLPASRESLESLRGLGAKTISRMRREAVDCPVAGKPRSFVECFACDSFIRRARGVVDCEGSRGEL
ncbi:MAG: hypothetical protein QW057_07855 [Candidatus Bathyarchaeia archaeon]